MIKTYKDFIQKYFKIQTKDSKLESFIFNGAQSRFYEQFKKDYGDKPCRYIILKARQMGISTLTEALITALTIANKHTNAVIIAHNSDASSNIYAMTKRFIDNLPDALVPQQKYSNRKEIVFDGENGNDSSIRVMANGDGVRSSTFRYAHLSEFAFWDKPNETLTALMQSIPQDNKTMAIIESTANGYNHFYDLWKKAVDKENDFVPLFFPWYIEKGYTRPYYNETLTQEEKNIKETLNLTNEQMMWRRWCINNNCQGDVNKFKQEYPSTPEEAFITTNDCVFDVDKINMRISNLPKPLKKGYFAYNYDGLLISDIKWVDDANGYITIYKETSDYTAIGSDTAGTGTDYFTAQVLDRQGNQIATMRKQFDEDVFTKQLYCLGTYFNSIVAIETNFSTYPIQEMKRLKYKHLYVRKTYDNMLDNYESKYGFKTTVLTRPYIIAQLVEIYREHIDRINDIETLKEALTFVNKDGKPQAENGAHDDLIMALAIAYECLKQIPIKKEERKETKEDFFSYGF